MIEKLLTYSVSPGPEGSVEQPEVHAICLHWKTIECALGNKSSAWNECGSKPAWMSGPHVRHSSYIPIRCLWRKYHSLFKKKKKKQSSDIIDPLVLIVNVIRSQIIQVILLPPVSVTWKV